MTLDPARTPPTSPTREFLTAWTTENGLSLGWAAVHRLLTTADPDAAALWADLDGLQVDTLPARMPTTTRIWLWSATAMWRIVPWQRPDAAPAARVARLTPSSSPAPPIDGAHATTETVEVHHLPPADLPDGLRRRLQQAGTPVAALDQADARLVIPLRFLALRSRH